MWPNATGGTGLALMVGMAHTNAPDLSAYAHHNDPLQEWAIDTCDKLAARIDEAHAVIGRAVLRGESVVGPILMGGKAHEALKAAWRLPPREQAGALGIATEAVADLWRSIAARGWT